MESYGSCSFTRNILNELDINPKIISRAEKAGFFTASSILSVPQAELEKKLCLSSFHISNLLDAVVAYVIPKQLTALELSQSGKEKPRCITTGCQRLDDFLGGGVPMRGITEVTGPSGSGKTQLALQLCLCTQLPLACGGLDKGVVYISTESLFPLRRLQQMIKTFTVKYNHDEDTYTDTVLVQHIPDLDALVNTVLYQLPNLMSRYPIGLVVIDSVASPFRVEESNFENKELLYKMGYNLHHMAETLGIAVVAINQVRASMEEEEDLYGHQDSVVPTLGLSWANLVTTRLMINRTSYHAFPKTEGDNNSAQKESDKIALKYNVRRLEVIFSPWLERKSCHFLVTNKGIEDVECE